jgi:hypothetical protein
MMPVYPRLHVYGASTRGAIFGGVLWIEGGYFDSRDDKGGDNPYMPNSQAQGLVGFERQVATNLTANLQWQVDYMTGYDKFKAQQEAAGAPFIRDEVRHLLTSRVTRKLWDENLTLSGFVFWSPSDQDVYFRPNAEYKYTDEIAIAVGGNVFAGKYDNTEFGQFQKNDNAYLKVTYGFY